MRKYHFFIVFIISIVTGSLFGQGNFDCATSTITACNGNPQFPFTTNNGANTWGNVQDLPGNSTSSISNPATNPASSNMGCLLSGELNATWVQINISSPGTLQFNISQSGFTDWAMWPYNNTACANIQNNTLAPIRCNWNMSASGGTGIGPVPAGGDPGNFEPVLNVTAGQSFIVCISNFSNVNGMVNMSFTGTAGTTCVPYSSSNSQSICPSGTATISATTNLASPSYTWMPGGLNTATINVSPASTTVYTVTIVGTNTVTNAVTTQTNTSTVTVYTVPVINLNSNSMVCQGSAINLSTTTGLTSYTWTGPQSLNQTTGVGTFSIPNANINMAGSYSVLAQTAQGCTTTATNTVGVIQTSSITVTPTIAVCQGSNVLLTANVSAPAANSYTWSGPASYSSVLQNPVLSNVIPSQSGIYTVHAGFTSGATTCTTINTTSVTVYALPTLTLTSNSLVCQGSNIDLMATPGIGTYTWTGPLGLNQVTNTETLTIPNANAGMAGTYTVLAQTPQSCSATATTSVGIISTSSVTVGNSVVVCQGGSIFLSSNTSSPSANSYSWSGPGGFSSNLQNQSVLNVSPIHTGIYTVTASFTNGGTTCTRTNTMSVTIIPSGNIPLNPIPDICNNGNINLSAPSGGNVYAWDGPDGFTSAAQNPVILNATISQQGVYTVSVTTSGCVNTGSVNVNVNDVLNFITTPASITLCNGQTAVLSAIGNGGSGAYSYSWTPSLNLSSSNSAVTTVTANTTTTYTLILSDSNCSVTQKINVPVTVSVNPTPVITFTTSNARGCEPFCTDLISSSNPPSANCSWKFSNNLTSNSCNAANYCFNAHGIYNATLTVTDVNGCVDSLSQGAFIIVDPKPAPSFEMSPDNPTIFENEVSFYDYSYLGSPMQSWHWDFGDGYVSTEQDTSNLQNTSHIYENVGTYTVSLAVTNSFGCKDTVLRIVKVEDDFALFIPNAFSPTKSENTNDVFNVKGTGFKKEGYEMLIYDRWGHLVFRSEDIEKGWDGAVKGGPKAEQGVYIYKITIKDYRNHEREFVGHVSVF